MTVLGAGRADSDEAAARVGSSTSLLRSRGLRLNIEPISSAIRSSAVFPAGLSPVVT